MSTPAQCPISHLKIREKEGDRTRFLSHRGLGADDALPAQTGQSTGWRVLLRFSSFLPAIPGRAGEDGVLRCTVQPLPSP